MTPTVPLLGWGPLLPKSFPLPAPTRCWGSPITGGDPREGRGGSLGVGALDPLPFRGSSPTEAAGTVFVHVDFQALLQPAGPALVPVRLVHRAAPLQGRGTSGRAKPSQAEPGQAGPSLQHPRQRQWRPPRGSPVSPGAGSGCRVSRGRCAAYLVPRFAHIGPIPPDAPLEKPRAPIAGVHPVVLPGAAVPAHFAGDVQNAT